MAESAHLESEKRSFNQLIMGQSDRNGDRVTHPLLKKVSKGYRFDEMLSDTEISEDYDGDGFFEGLQPALFPQLKSSDVFADDDRRATTLAGKVLAQHRQESEIQRI